MQENKHVLIIAEAGVNHNGDLDLAMEMARVAKACGADAVKYQTAVPELVISMFAPKAEYQKQTTGDKESQLEMVRKLHFDFDGHRRLKEYCDSIGMSVPEEIGAAIRVLKENGAGEITLLHCNTEYPTMYEDANLGAMVWLREHFGCPVGLSDHTNGTICDVAATALGAVVIEKHFTLDKNMEGPDHKASLEPAELAEMVRAVRCTEAAMGSGIKAVSPSEAKNKPIARKSIVAARRISAGELLTEENLTTKRPGSGIDPMRWNEVLGTRAVRDFEPDELIEL